MLTVSVYAHQVLNRFDPETAFGGCLDGGTPAETAALFRPSTLRRMRAVGLSPLAYRLRTELAVEAWHWNPQGRFSAGDRGYWTGSDRPGRPLLAGYGYRLPRRGNTFDQANDDGYSRLTDGDPSSFWKSNPYLDAANPQWILVRLPKAQPVDALRIRWAEPYALRYRVEYWDGDDRTDVDGGQEGVWRSLNVSEFRGHGGCETRHLRRVENVRWVRLKLLASSHTSRRSHDRRDALGFAIREIGVGTLRNGRFHDALIHRPNHRQSPTWASSTDPWHRASDRDLRLVQPGLDRILRSGLTRGLPILMPAGVLYDTPENMSALFRWLRARHVLIRGFEMGEEPDGQVCAPEDYGALYLRTAAALRAVDPRVVLGGPGFQTIESDYAAWTFAPSGGRRNANWVARFLASLRSRRRIDRLRFFSFEWYPFDDVTAAPASQLARAPRLLERALARQALPPGLPLVMTEYGYSAYAAPAAVDLPGGLLNLDLVGRFFARGGRVAYLYGLPPSPLSADRKGFWGALATSLPDGTHLPTYWAAHLLTETWCGVRTRRSGERPRAFCELLRTEVPESLVSAYALRRPDGRFSVLVLNKDPRRPHSVRLAIDGRTKVEGNLTQYGRTQYVWHPDGPHGHSSRSRPPLRSHFRDSIVLPPFSVTVATL